METTPTVIATGDFLYFAPTGQAYTIPEDGTVSVTARPDPTDPIWTEFILGTVTKPTTDKFTGKDVVIKSPIPGTGIIAAKKVLRPERGLTMEVEMNEFGRLAAAAFYKAPLIQSADVSFFPLSGQGSIEGWLQRQRYDNDNGLWITDSWYVDCNVTDIKYGEQSIVNPTFMFTWLYAALAGSSI